MHIIWKRPDGFQNAVPEDFRRISLSNGAHLWVHRHEQDWYPFQVSGDWGGQTLTTRLNRLVNLLESRDEDWTQFLDHCNDDDMQEGGFKATAAKLVEWIASVREAAKGETWEVHIIQCALDDIQNRLKKVAALSG